VEERPCEISGINRTPRRPKGSQVWTPDVLGALDRQVLSAALIGCSRSPAPDILGFLTLTGCFRPFAPGVLGFLILTGCSQSSAPGVLGFLTLTGCSRSPVPGVFSFLIPTGYFRSPAGERVTLNVKLQVYDEVY